MSAHGVFIDQGYTALLAGIYNRALYSPVADKEVTALAEDEHGNLLFFAEANKLSGLPGVLRREEQLGRTADLKACIILHRHFALGTAFE